MTKTKLLAVALLLVPSIASASVEISEVMYDPSGTDSGREWVEVWNRSSSSVDLALWALVEGGVSHRIGAAGEAATLGAGERAVIADKPDLFAVDHPNARPVFDSAFSLSNSGERISLVSPDGVETSSTEWGSGSGASDGKSWQRSGETWIAAAPTPAAENADREEAATTSSPAVSAASVSAHSATVGLSTVRSQPKLRVDAGRDRIVPVGVELDVEPTTEGADRASYSWSWGDGESSRGRRGRHVYRFPGTYVLVLNARAQGGAAATSRALVTVAEVSLSAETLAHPEGSAVRLSSASPHELNLGGFSIEAGEESVTVAPDTILLPGGSVLVALGRLEDAVLAGTPVVVRRPDGRVAAGS